uniref:Uncharacterized protein n=1 Tax=Strongyloides venezuelensis TaxID=75913 RepID=A0A0K0FJP9_STRVS
MVYFDLLWGLRSGKNSTNITASSNNDKFKLKKIKCNNVQSDDTIEPNINRIVAAQTSLNFGVQLNERDRLSSVIQTQIPWVEQTGISRILAKFCCTKSYRQQKIQQRQLAKRIFSTQFPPIKYN